MSNFNPLQLGFSRNDDYFPDKSFAISATIVETYTLTIGNHLFILKKLWGFAHQWCLTGNKINGFSGVITLAYLNKGSFLIDLIKELDRIKIRDVYEPRHELLDVIILHLLPHARKHYIDECLLSL